MEITLNSVIADVGRRRHSELKSSNPIQEKKEPLPQKQDWSINQRNEQLDEEQLKAAIEQVNNTLALHSTRLEFSIHDKTKGIMVKVIDQKTGELIREVPPERVLDMVAMTWEELGLLVDEKA